MMPYDYSIGRFVATHGESIKGGESVEYSAWASMKARCLMRSHPAYPQYGGRGITICDAWRDSYECFLNDVGRRPSPDHSIDRIDNDGNYEPGNVRWATRTEQSRNRRTNVFLTVGDETHTIAVWEEITGINRYTLYQRLERCWPPEDIISNQSDRRKRLPSLVYKSGHKLTVDQVQAIRKRSATDTITQLSKDYGVERSTIRALLSGKTWSHVPS